MKLLFSVHVLELVEALLELLPGRRALAECGNHLYDVEARLLVRIVEQLNYAVEHLQIVDFNFACLQLSQRRQGARGCCSNLAYFIKKHLCQGLDGFSLDGPLLTVDVERDGADVEGG